MDFLSNEIYGNTLLKWITSVVIVVLSVLLSRIIYMFVSKVLKKELRKAVGNLMI